MKTEIISQYSASLQMLMDAIEKCPDELWESDAYPNTYWRVAYHAIFYTAIYLSANQDSFTPWDKHVANYNTLGPLSREQEPIIIEKIYTKAELLEYAASVFSSLENLLTDTGFDAPSGFEWRPINKLELHLYNIRHLQHHTGQLVDRLRSMGLSIRWRG